MHEPIMATLTYIIICYNSAAVIDANMHALLNQTPHQVIIIDNNSTDGSLALLKHRFSQCTILSLPQNIGYGRAANVAIDCCETSHCLLINPDVSITADDVSHLLREADKYSEAAILAPATQPKHQALGTGPIEQTFLNGSCMLLDRQKIKNLGAFDTAIFLFSEEADLCTRCTQAGYQLLLFPQIAAQHFKGQSSGNSKALIFMRNWHFAWSRAYYFNKHKMARGKRSPWRRLVTYGWKFITASSAEKRIKYRANLSGTIAFLRGSEAFQTDGNAIASLRSPMNPYRD
jgi:GT2 family glycosyltransferase